MRALAGAVAACLVAIAFTGPAQGLVLDTSPEELLEPIVDVDLVGSTLLVGFTPGSELAVASAIELAGGVVRRWIPEIAVAIVDAPDATLFSRVALLSSAIEFVETDDATRLAGAQWNGAQWNGAQWNGAQWNGAQWNGAQWNGAQWNTKDWSDAQKNALRWTFEQADKTYVYDVTTSDPGLVWSWGTWAAKVPEAWKTSTSGADLCVLDSGVDSDHPDIAPNLAASWSAFDPGRPGEDDAGHGTHVAGVAAAAVGNAFGVAGVSNARIYSAKVLNAEGTGTESDLALGLLWCAHQGADVALMALSADSTSPTLDRAIGFASERDVLLVASAGNTGATVSYPASDPRVLGVGAVGGDLALATFSARGAGLDLVAPGVYILGPFLDGGFAFGSGTSQAAASVAGVAALLRASAPALSAEEIGDTLLASALDLGLPGPDPVYGSGLLDASRALAAAGGQPA